MAGSKQIVMWAGEDILSSSIMYFLAARSNWKVVSLSTTDTLAALILAVKNSKPDIVIIHKGLRNCPTNLPIRLLQFQPAMKVILVSLKNNKMDVYTKQTVMVKEAADLVTLIENEP